MNSKLKIGIPNGSLVDSNRGGLKELLDRARIYTRNLGTNAPPVVTNIPWLEPVVGRPQELPALAAEGMVDIFFCGDDWATEWALRGRSNERLYGLGVGSVDIVVAEKPDLIDKSRRLVATEYPFLARKWVSGKVGAAEEEIPLIRIGDSVPDGVRAVIIESYGATEAKAYYGLVDAIVEATQSGSTIENFGLRVTETLMRSQCSLYAGPGAKGDEWSTKKTERVKMMLEGAVRAQGRDLLTFNVANQYLERVLDYVRKAELFGGEESVVRGDEMAELTIEVTTRDPRRPLIDIVGDLKDLGASSIDGLPLSYSIL